MSVADITIYLSISICLPVCLSVYLSIYLSNVINYVVSKSGYVSLHITALYCFNFILRKLLYTLTNFLIFMLFLFFSILVSF